MYDDYLDKGLSGPKWLNNEIAAGIVKDGIHFGDNKKYDLIAYTIMPNHVHLVIKPIAELLNATRMSETEFRSTSPADKSESLKNGRVSETEFRSTSSQYVVTKILQDMKKYTARECNKALNGSGAFWQHESYDHVIRNSESLRRIVNYVLNNPVKAGLADKQEDWKFNYYNPEFLL